MAAERFCVVFGGQIAEGFSHEQVRDNLAAQFKLSEKQLATLFSGRKLVLKKGLSRAQAVKLRNLLARAGALGLVREEPGAETSAEPGAGTGAEEAGVATGGSTAAAQSAGARAPEPAAEDERITCPRCGHEQPRSNACSLCRMDMRLHLQRLAKRRRLREAIAAG